MFEPFPLGLGGDDGVIDMELLSVIRRWHYRDHFSIRETSRRTGLSRNTVRKYLRSDAVEPKFNIPDRPSKLAPYADKLSQMLRQEAGKSRKQKRTTKQLHTDLALGYDGSYNRVAAFARDWKAARQQEQQRCGRGVAHAKGPPGPVRILPKRRSDERTVVRYHADVSAVPLPAPIRMGARMDGDASRRSEA